MIVLLAAKAMTPGSLSQHFDTSRQAISKHLRVLAECEVVTLELRGREIYYHLNPQKMKEIDTWLEQFRAMWETRFSQLDSVLSNQSPEQP